MIVPALVDDESAGDEARRALANDELAAPELLDLEVVSAVRGLRRGGILSEPRALQALASLARTQIGRSPHRPLLPRIWELRDNLSVYDASYVALAEGLRVVLVTADKRLAAAPGIRCEIDLVA